MLMSYMGSPLSRIGFITGAHSSVIQSSPSVKLARSSGVMTMPTGFQLSTMSSLCVEGLKDFLSSMYPRDIQLLKFRALLGVPDAAKYLWVSGGRRPDIPE